MSIFFRSGTHAVMPAGSVIFLRKQIPQSLRHRGLSVKFRGGGEKWTTLKEYCNTAFLTAITELLALKGL